MTEKLWNYVFEPGAKKDFARLDGSLRDVVMKAIRRVRINPLPQSEGGYGKPLGNKGGSDLTGLLKVKLKKSGIRIVYYLVREAETMTIVVIGLRADSEVYKEAARRIRSSNRQS